MTDKQLRSNRELPYFILCILFSLLIYVIAIATIFGVAIFVVLFLISTYALIMHLGYVRANGIRISERQFPDVYERITRMSHDMKLKRVPDIFVVHSEGAFNAFATRFLGKNMVVLYSEVFELAREQGEAELDFIIAHELTHIKRNHIWKNILIMPAQLLPFLSQAYSRACEYTCDRQAAYFIQDGAAAKRGLTILSIGKELYKEVNEDAYLEQISTESNVITWLGEILSSHPTTPKRVQAVGHFMQVEGTPTYYPNANKIALGVGALFGIFFIGYFGIIAIVLAGSLTYASIFPEDFFENEAALNTSVSEESTVDASSAPLPMESLNMTPLMEAVVNGDYITVQELVASGVDLEERDAEETTALHHAVYANDTRLAYILLEAGANANTEDLYSNALTASFYEDNYELAALLHVYGADPTKIDPEGYSGTNILGVSEEQFADTVKGLIPE
ncbi:MULTISPECIES: M48 family metallopeptidase [Psychrobacillus]|uniref:M48 family metalloprotease n=1 Tax=Psychrobacillus faecigallinarum TaxID=2762235 RepID=A0ABR8RAN0_9BACI|nr:MULTISPECIES: M48 family metallopeptidase [Psychrobacillus]MBD7944846.1 M48 family metalloprotease [Psychrobacillus faecigallinarum]QEY21295.1 heat-shock protein HtpX [Psychrobacillus sp. AK 1817]